jgi:hypothetical protein
MKQIIERVFGESKPEKILFINKGEINDPYRQVKT